MMVGHDLENAIHSTDSRAAFTCARFHLRNGKRRLQKGLTIEGMIALYDSILFAIRYYIIQHRSCESFVEATDLGDAASLFYAVTRAGVFEDPLVFNRFSLIVERVLWQSFYSFNADIILSDVETTLMKLGVLPFNGSSLPQEIQNIEHIKLKGR